MADRPAPKGRGSHLNPPNRFEKIHYEDDFEQLEHDEEYLKGLRNPPTEYFRDHARSIVTANDSPDVPSATASIPTEAARTAVRTVSLDPPTNTWG